MSAGANSRRGEIGSCGDSFLFLGSRQPERSGHVDLRERGSLRWWVDGLGVGGLILGRRLRRRRCVVMVVRRSFWTWRAMVSFADSEARVAMAGDGGWLVGRDAMSEGGVRARQVHPSAEAAGLASGRGVLLGDQGTVSVSSLVGALLGRVRQVAVAARLGGNSARCAAAEPIRRRGRSHAAACSSTPLWEAGFDEKLVEPVDGMLVQEPGPRQRWRIAGAPRAGGANASRVYDLGGGTFDARTATAGGWPV